MSLRVSIGLVLLIVAGARVAVANDGDGLDPATAPKRKTAGQVDVAQLVAATKALARARVHHEQFLRGRREDAPASALAFRESLAEVSVLSRSFPPGADRQRLGLATNLLAIEATFATRGGRLIGAKQARAYLDFEALGTERTHKVSKAWRGVSAFRRARTAEYGPTYKTKYTDAKEHAEGMRRLARDAHEAVVALLSDAETRPYAFVLAAAYTSRARSLQDRYITNEWGTMYRVSTAGLLDSNALLSADARRTQAAELSRMDAEGVNEAPPGRPGMTGVLEDEANVTARRVGGTLRGAAPHQVLSVLVHVPKGLITEATLKTIQLKVEDPRGIVVHEGTYAVPGVTSAYEIDFLLPSPIRRGNYVASTVNLLSNGQVVAQTRTVRR